MGYFPSAFRLSVTALLNSFDILNTGTSFSSTITFSPVLGLRAWRRFLCLILKEPKPLISMRFLVFSESMMLSKRLLTADSLSLSVKPVFWATVPIRSAFVVVVFMVGIWFVVIGVGSLLSSKRERRQVAFHRIMPGKSKLAMDPVS